MNEIFLLMHETRREILVLRKDMDLKFAKVDIRFAEMRAEIIKWMIGISAGQAALIISIGKLFH